MLIRATIFAFCCLGNIVYPMRKNKPLESLIQSRIIKRLEKDGWMVIKLGLTNMPGIPDLLALKDGRARFIEVKRPGEKPRPLQEYRHRQLRENGFDVEVMDE